MSWKRIAAYYLAAALVGGLLWSEWSARQTGADELAALPESPLVELDPAAVDLVSVRVDARELRLERSAAGWAVLHPAGARVPPDLVDAILDTLASIAPIETVAVGQSSAKEYGLGQGGVSIALAGRDGRGQVVEFGRRNPTGTAVYARVEGRAEVRLLGLNARYYIDLLLEGMRGQWPGQPGG